MSEMTLLAETSLMYIFNLALFCLSFSKLKQDTEQLEGYNIKYSHCMTTKLIITYSIYQVVSLYISYWTSYVETYRTSLRTAL